MNDYDIFAISPDEVLRDIASRRAKDWRLLRRLSLPRVLNEPRGGSRKRALVVDVEITGLSPEVDEVFQLAMLPFSGVADCGRHRRAAGRISRRGWLVRRPPDVLLGAKIG